MLSALVAQSLLALSTVAGMAGPAFTLHGKVLDPVHAPVVAARVTATAAGQGPSYSTLSDGSGAFNLPVAPGKYTITVTAPGFLEAATTLEALEAGEGAKDFVLRIAGFRD